MTLKGTTKYTPKPGPTPRGGKGRGTPVRKNSLPVSSLGSGNAVVGGKQYANVPLTEMQRKFVMCLVHDKMNNTTAARQAGFNQPGTAAHALVRNPRVIKAIAEERELYAKASGMTKQKVIDGFAEAIDIGRIKADPLSMISGWREIGKMCGFYEPTKTEIKVSMHGQMMVQQMQSLSDAELLRLVDESDEGMGVLEGDFRVVDKES